LLGARVLPCPVLHRPSARRRKAVVVLHSEDAYRIAAIVAERRADAVEVCLARGGVAVLRNLLQELIRLGRRDVSM
jgi:hypothetical protein